MKVCCATEHCLSKWFVPPTNMGMQPDLHALHGGFTGQKSQMNAKAISRRLHFCIEAAICAFVQGRGLLQHEAPPESIPGGPTSRHQGCPEVQNCIAESIQRCTAQESMLPAIHMAPVATLQADQHHELCDHSVGDEEDSAVTIAVWGGLRPMRAVATRARR